MGDRGNIIVHTPNEAPVYIYTHWHGYRLPQLLADALDTPQAKGRVGDSAYLTRIVFCQIIKAVDDLDGATGWGISTSVQDNEHDFVHLDAMNGKVAISPSESKPDIGWMETSELRSIEEFA